MEVVQHSSNEGPSVPYFIHTEQYEGATVELNNQNPTI